jgi:hypothetical protein
VIDQPKLERCSPAFSQVVIDSLINDACLSPTLFDVHFVEETFFKAAFFNGPKSIPIPRVKKSAAAADSSIDTLQHALDR